MLIDVFTERGFTAVVDIRKMEVPSRIDPKSYEIINRVKKVYQKNKFCRIQDQTGTITFFFYIWILVILL